jgi:hypothetical protein
MITSAKINAPVDLLEPPPVGFDAPAAERPHVVLGGGDAGDGEAVEPDVPERVLGLRRQAGDEEAAEHQRGRRPGPRGSGAGRSARALIPWRAPRDPLAHGPAPRSPAAAPSPTCGVNAVRR